MLKKADKQNILDQKKLIANFFLDKDYLLPEFLIDLDYDLKLEIYNELFEKDKNHEMISELLFRLYQENNEEIGYLINSLKYNNNNKNAIDYCCENIKVIIEKTKEIQLIIYCSYELDCKIKANQLKDHDKIIL